MLDETGPTDQSRVLAELLDAALADNWTETGPTMALLWQSSADPDDLRLAVKDLEQPVEDELALLNPDWTYLAVATPRSPGSHRLNCSPDPTTDRSESRSPSTSVPSPACCAIPTAALSGSGLSNSP